MKDLVIPFYVKLCGVLLCLIALGYLAILGHTLLAPFFLGLLFAILLLPLANFFECKVHLPRAAASGVSILGLLIVVILVFFLIGDQLRFLVREWPHLHEQINRSFHEFQQWIQETFHVEVAKQVSYLNGLTEKALSTSTSLVGVALVSISGILVFFIFTLLYSFFILLYRRRLVAFLIASFKEENTPIVVQVLERVQYMIKKYIVGLFIEMAVVATLASVLFWILGSHYVLLLGLITGIFNVIPYVGIFTALLVSGIITFATATPAKALFMILAIICVHLLDSNVLMPQIVGSKVKLNALVIILGVVIGEMLWGISGMFVAIPALAIMKIVFDHVQDLKPWGILLGDEEGTNLSKKQALVSKSEKGAS